MYQDGKDCSVVKSTCFFQEDLGSVISTHMTVNNSNFTVSDAHILPL